MNAKLLYFTLASALLAGCGDALDSDLLEAASTTDVQQTGDYPATVLVATPEGRGMCTGTFVSPRAVLTAAHCTTESGLYRVYTSFGWFKTAVVEKLGSGVVDDPNDISMLVFDNDVADPARGRVVAIGAQPKKGDEIRIIGFGCNNIDERTGAGIKRTGTNRVHEITDYLELLTTPSETVAAAHRILGPENQAASCFGDSGGPMLQIQDGTWKITGVTHAGGRSSAMIRSQYINLNRSDNLAFLKEVDRDYSLQLFNGCWTYADAEACLPSSAGFRIFAFIGNLFLKLLSWFW